MANPIKNLRWGAAKLFSTIWSIFTYPYRAIRSLLFIPIYPARVLFNHQSDEYNEIRDYFVINHAAYIVSYDLRGTMQRGEITDVQKQDTANRYFDAAIFTTDSSNIYNPNKQFIIMADGNATCYEIFANTMNGMANDNTNVIGFNPMGVGISPGITSGPEDYQAAIKSIIDNLHNNGIPYDRIVLQGRSLGAAMCLTVAEQYQARGQRVKVVADRTFGRLDNTAGAMIGWLVYYPVKALIILLGLNVDAAAAFNNINQKNPGDAIGLSSVNDGVIPESCNLYNSVIPSMREQGFVKEFAATPEYRDYETHNLPSDFIEENDNTELRIRRSGTEFIQECIQQFKAQIANKIATAEPQAYAKSIVAVKRNPAPVTHLKNAREAANKKTTLSSVGSNNKVHPKNDGLRRPLIQKRKNSVE